MGLTEQERTLEKSTAGGHGSLSLGLFATALLVYNVSDGLWWIFVVLGAVFALSAIYLVFFHRWKRKEILAIAANVRIKYVAWFLGFIALGIGLIQTQTNKWVVPGLICIPLAYAILVFGIVGGVKEMAAKKTKYRGREVKAEKSNDK